MNALSGRKFATRVVLTSFYDPEMYHNRVFKWKKKLFFSRHLLSSMF